MAIIADIHSDQTAARPHRSGRLYLWVLMAIAAGVALGHFAPDLAVRFKLLGDLFVQLVRLVIPPVIFLTIVTGIAGMGSLGALGKVALKALGYFLVVSTFALIVGVISANVLHPGAGMNIDPATLNTDSVKDYVAKAHDATVTGFLRDLIPTSFVGVFVKGDILQVLIVAILFGVGFSMAGERARPALVVLEAFSQAVFRVVDILMKLAPLGAFGAMAFTIGKYGIGAIVNLAALVGSFYATSLVFILVVLGFVALLNGFSILRLLAYIKSEILLVIGTSSSESALPSLMEKLEAAGCGRSVVGLVVPTGYSFNLDGTNIYMSLAALFIAQATNTHLSLEQQLLLLGVAMLSSKGAAGVTGAGFITLAATLSVIPAVPVAGIAIILGVDRFMSECRAVTNFIGNAVATIVISRWQGELDQDMLAEALSGRRNKAYPPDVTAQKCD
ncbi:MAG: C4-dicarboxylate transporter DctA [Asticcacaulis sp.]|uniref:C4-dicarboxylate transporter DctA n=1 Tax=Asticcacaulis sp. TaxID=1872648 RepID=UPI003F7B791C